MYAIMSMLSSENAAIFDMFRNFKRAELVPERYEPVLYQSGMPTVASAMFGVCFFSGL